MGNSKDRIRHATPELTPAPSVSPYVSSSTEDDGENEQIRRERNLVDLKLQLASESSETTTEDGEPMTEVATLEFATPSATPDTSPLTTPVASPRDTGNSSDNPYEIEERTGDFMTLDSVSRRRPNEEDV